MTDEKRKHGRLPLVMETSWEGSGSKSLARTVDISATGCFIDTLAPVEVGETLSLRLTLHGGEYISLQGVVMYRMPSLGFGVRFTRVSDSDRLRLDALLDMQAKDTRRTG
ncbi:MAG TPA: PilZ domain-containing protein [Pyrinomonadaceae bacterium]|nr:PilZ domain-containing protein [Pyrinomonadaceae bacterium]